MDKAPDEKTTQKRHQREKGVLDHLANQVYQEKAPQGQVQSPTTDSGLPVEEQVRKEWDPKKGGLPTF